MIYKSNAQEVLDRIKSQLLAPAAQDKLLKTISQAIYASNLQRIHNEGRNIRMGRIGSYSLKPLYVNPKNSPRKFSLLGKSGNARFASTGMPHKTRYFSTGYYGFRQQIGRETNYVNFQLSGSLKANWQMQKSPSGYGYVIGFLSAKYGARAEALEIKFAGAPGTVWGVTDQDRQNIDTIIKNWSHAGTK